MSILTYEEVILEWALAELLSPTWRSDPHWSDEISKLLRAKVLELGADSLNPDERTWLSGRLLQFRALIIGTYGPRSSWRFNKRVASAESISRFGVIDSFRIPGSSMDDLSTKVRYEDYFQMRDRVQEIIDSKRPERYSPIAVSRKDRVPILIEGYKRVFSAMWTSTAWLEIIFCEPT